MCRVEPVTALVSRKEPLISRERSASEVVWRPCHLPGTPRRTPRSGLTQDADAIVLKFINVVPSVSSKNKVPSLHFVRLQVSTIQIDMSCDLRQIDLHLSEGHRAWDAYIHILILSDCVNASLLNAPQRLCTACPLRQVSPPARCFRPRLQMTIMLWYHPPQCRGPYPCLR
ncbi:hypothetical protein EDD16DRAFT_1026985 [Pisolithus croceorrhizus]|nr:hypothetical protein EDD16DRAFT_1026985 [Pisolithus croceorrhizus]